MCGINGVICFREKTNANELKSMVHMMNEKILYRGPNDEGIYAEKSFGNCQYIIKKLQKVILSRNFIGEKPYYYYYDSDKLMFG